MARDQNRPQGSAVDTAATDVIISLGPENRPTPAAELLRAEAAAVKADHVAMDHAGAERVSAERVVMNNSGARIVEARSAQIDRSGILAVRSEKSVLYNSTALAVAAKEARIVRGNVFALKADRVSIEGDARVGVYVGPAIDGLRPLLDTQTAVALGAGFGAVLLLLGGVLRRVPRLR